MASIARVVAPGIVPLLARVPDFADLIAASPNQARSPAASTFLPIAGIKGAAKDRVVTAEEVVAREPDLIIGSWSARNSGLSEL